MTACDRCLRRAELIGLLAPLIADGVRKPRERTRLLLALPDRDLIQAVAPGSAEALVEQLRGFDASAFRRRMAAAEIGAICRHDPAYPPQLAQLDDAPNPLFLRGNQDALTDCVGSPAVAIVGGRRASTYALEVAHELGRCLAVAGVPVISGLALGVDAAAHRGALAGDGRAIAVLASGADVPYPSQHRRLYRQVVERGVVLSEMPPGAGVRKWTFPARNRIMAALAQLVVVVEAAENSGTLITAEFAEASGREVGAVPGRINARAAAGSNRLIADGATVILDVDDILDAIFHAGARPVPPPKIELDPSTAAVLDLVEAGDSPFEAGIHDAKGVRAALGRLEVLGLVRRDGLGGYERTGMRCVRF